MSISNLGTTIMVNEARIWNHFIMKMVYNVKDRPPLGMNVVYALQQVLAILAATILVPTIIGNGMSQAAALFGAGVGTFVYLLFTNFKSPVFLGSSFAFIGSMFAAFSGAAAAAYLGFLGLLLGAIFAGLVYVIIALIVKFFGTAWINKVMPAAVIGPTVAIIGLSLSGTAIQSVMNGAVFDGGLGAYVFDVNAGVGIVCGLVALFGTIVASVYGGKNVKLIPFIIGIGAGYVCASIFTGIGWLSGNDALKVIDFTIFARITEGSAWLPDFTFIKAFQGFADLNWTYVGTIAVAYVPVAFVVFAEHLADHKNISSIIEKDLLEDPGLDKTLLGDGIGSIAGAFFGGCPNTTYGESVGCVAITKNASISTIMIAAGMCIIISFLAPFMLLLASIPSCVINGVCIALYGFIAVSGLKMIQKVNLEDNANLFTVSTILITGVGSFALSFAVNATQYVTLTEVACALILGIIVNLVVGGMSKKSVEKAQAYSAKITAAKEEAEKAEEEEGEKAVEQAEVTE